jgi:hypothetical protein
MGLSPGILQDRTDIWEWLYGGEDLLRNRLGLAYPALIRPFRLEDPEQVLGDLVPDDREFPATSPLLTRLQGANAHLWNGRTYVFRELEPGPDGPRLRCSPGFYFDALNTCAMLRAELADALAEGGSGTPPALYPRLARRFDLHRGARGAAAAAQAWSGEGRSAAVAISCLFAVRAEDGYRFCVERRSLHLADDPGAYHVVPSMVFQPAAGDASGRTGYSITETILREIGEELFSADGEAEQAARAEAALGDLRRHLALGSAALQVSGLALNLLDLRPEILAVLAVDDPGWLRRHGPAVRIAASEFRDDPEGRVAMAGTQAFRPLPDAAALSAEGEFGPGRSVVGGAAAVILGLPLLARLFTPATAGARV